MNETTAHKETDETSAVDRLDDSPLMAELADEQLKLLSLIWEPIKETAFTQGIPQWPLWDYVSRSLHLAFPDLQDAEEVFRSLPLIGPDPWSSSSYGLVWTSDRNANFLRSDVVIGLTIAGLHRLELATAPPVLVSAALVQIVREVAEVESALTPIPNEVVSKQVALGMYTEWLVGRVDKKFTIPDDMTVELLRREPARVIFLGAQIQLEGAWLRPYRGASSVRDYIDIVTNRARKAERPRATSSPLTLIQTLDYLSLVIADLDVWKGSHRLVEAPDLQSAAALASEVSTVDEFTSSLIGVFNVIDRFGVPEIPKEVTLAQDKRRGAINRLEYWLTQFADEESSRERIREALDDVRAVVSLRHLSAHPGPDTRKRAAPNLRRLDLPYPVTDYAHAWGTCRTALALAFDAIRLELQSQPVDRD